MQRRITINFKIKNIFFIFYLLIIIFFTSPNQTLYGQTNIKLKLAFGVSFQKPIFMLPYPVFHKGLPKLYAVVEQAGVIKLVSKHRHSNSNQFARLLNMTSKICSRGSEEGLLGFAFSPDYAISHKAYIYYSVCSPRKTILSRIILTKRISKTKRQKKSISLRNLRFQFKEEVLLKISQPYSNHNGGMIQFSPKDGYLYIGTGDGGSGGDPRRNGQKLSTLLGKILRIDVTPTKGYKIPSDNPFRRVKKAKPEIFAYGLRNPWRFSFDKQGRLIVGDVGQNKYEEISIVKKGKNYGWNIMEGAHCYKKKNCIKRGLELPVIEYSHSEGQCIIGGYFYHGQQIPRLKNQYIFGDTITGRVWYTNLKIRNQKTLLFDTDYYIVSFALDEKGEIYIINLLGQIYQLTN